MKVIDLLKDKLKLTSGKKCNLLPKVNKVKFYFLIFHSISLIRLEINTIVSKNEKNLI